MKTYRQFPGRSLCGICGETIPLDPFPASFPDAMPCGHDIRHAAVESETWEVDERGNKVNRILPPEADAPT